MQGARGMMRFAATKAATKERKIETLAESPLLFMPLSSYHGHFAHPIVQAGDRVLKHQLIAEAGDPFSAHVHAPVSGHIVGMQDFLDRDEGMAASMLVLQNDFEGACIDIPEVPPSDPPPETILKLLAEAGVVGAGGAQFPAALKYRTAGHHVNAFILNGVECEPYLTADYALMREQTAALFEGIRLINTLLLAIEVVIVIESDNPELEAAFAPYLVQERYAGYRVQAVKDAYPQGSERHLSKAA